jgi:hypothetical protein
MVTGTIVQGNAPEALVTSVPLYAVVGSKPVYLRRVFADGTETTFRMAVPAGTRRSCWTRNKPAFAGEIARPGDSL